MKRIAQLAILLLAFGVAGCDHATKLLAVSALAKRPALSLIPSVLELTPTYNTDTGFSLLSRAIPLEPRLLLLKWTATIGLAFVVWYASARFRRAKWAERFGFALLIGGALGNAIDRWRWGYVVDFIHLNHWPVFNVADIALCVGVGLLFQQRRLEEKALSVKP